MIHNDRFPALSRRVLRLNIIGRVVIILGAIFALVVLIISLINDSTEIKIGGSLFAGMIFLIGLGVAEAYFLAAESIGVFLAIEMNTRGVSYAPTSKMTVEGERKSKIWEIEKPHEREAEAESTIRILVWKCDCETLNWGDATNCHKCNMPRGDKPGYSDEVTHTVYYDLRKKSGLYENEE